MGKEVVVELIQGEFNSIALKKELNNLLDEDKSNDMQSDFDLLRDKLGGVGASAKTAELMLGYLNFARDQ